MDWTWGREDGKLGTTGRKRVVAKKKEASVTCPRCDGQPVIKSLLKAQVCDTCGGTGKVHPGSYCQFCGRSIQIIYKGFLICANEVCEVEVDKRLTEKHTPLMNLIDADEYNRAWSMFE